MSEKKIIFQLVTPEKVVFEDEVNQVSLPTVQGEITVLANHLPLISVLTAGELKIKKDNKEYSVAVSGGFIEVTGKKIRVLADTAERAEEIDLARAEQAKKRAEELLKTKRSETKEFVKISAQLEKELTRLKVARKKKWGTSSPPPPI